MFTIEDFDTRFPKLNSEYFDNLLTKEKEQYLARYKKYCDMFISFLIDRLKLDDIENSMSKDENYLLPLKEKDYDFYQQLSSDKMKYLYLRNNLYIERLSSEEVKVLDESTEFNDSFIENTFQKVISDYPNENVTTNYGPDSSKYYVNSNNIILGLRIDDDYYPEGVNRVDLMLKRDSDVDFYINYIESKSKKVLNNNISVIRYDKYSIKKKDDIFSDQVVNDDIVKLK